MSNIVDWGKQRNYNFAVYTVNIVNNVGINKVTAFDVFDYPMPKKYKDLCSVYSDEYFRLFNMRKI